MERGFFPTGQIRTGVARSTPRQCKDRARVLPAPCCVDFGAGPEDHDVAATRSGATRISDVAYVSIQEDRRGRTPDRASSGRGRWCRDFAARLVLAIIVFLYVILFLA